MTNEQVKSILDRARNLQEFEVQVTVPVGFRFTGRVPYTMEILGNQAFVTVMALTLEEAREKAQEFFNQGLYD
jgi:hypothetical protein